MSNAEKGEARAQGALAAFLEKMRSEVRTRDADYQIAFWAGLSHEMREYLGKAVK